MINKIGLILTVIISAFLIKANSQTIQIPLRKANVSMEQLATKLEEDTLGFKNIPFKKLPLWSLRSLAYNPLQSTYEKIIDGKLTAIQFKTFVTINKLDTTYLVYQKLPMNRIHMITAIDQNGLKHLVIDANNNHDFSDDKVYTFDLTKDSISQYRIDVKISYYDGVTVKNVMVPLIFDPYSPNKSNAKELDVLFLKAFDNKIGDVKIDNQLYSVEIKFYNEIYKDAPFQIEVKKIIPNSPNENSFSYSRTDNIDFGFFQYRTQKLEHNILTLNFVKKNNFSGGEIGSKSPEIEEIDIVTNKPFSLKKLQGKYTLIDFWGSWCGPCIALLPELKNINESYKNKIQFVSVAYDKEKSKDKLRELIAIHKMYWAQVFDNMEENQSKIARAYKVQEFPTSILIDPKGVVVFRATGANGLKDLISYVNSKGIVP